MSHRSSLFEPGRTRAKSDPPLMRFKRAIVLPLLNVLVPGSAQFLMGRRVLGGFAIAIWLGLLGAVGVLYWRTRTNAAAVIDLLTDSEVLMGVRIAILVLAAGWVFLLIDAWRLAAPGRQRWFRQGAIIVLNVALIATIGGAAAYVSQFVGVSRNVVNKVFTETETSDPLQGRYNILLIGADSGDKRFGLRPDSMVVASIDSSTGRTVLISIPRNLQNAPFAEDSPMRQVYPNGFNCGPECLINAVHTAASDRPDLYPGAESPGLEATLDAVEGVTGLTMNYYAMVNMAGFESLIDAVGGVEVDVKTRLPKFGENDAWKNVYLEPGVQRLSGKDALWYARSRFGSDDYSRMGRQKCLMSAMLEQMTPTTVVTNAIEMAQAGGDLLRTSIPRKELGQFAELALKARGEKLRTVSLVPPEVNPQAPDYVAVHQMIADAIAASEGKNAAGGSRSPEAPGTAPTTPTPTPTPTLGSPSPSPTGEGDGTDGEGANNVEDLSAVC